MDRLTVGETFFIDQADKFSKSSQKYKKKPTRVVHAAQLPKNSHVTKLLRENYEDIHRQAERITTSNMPTRETLVNLRYSHIPVNPGVPMGYSKEEPTFKHYKEINEQMLYIPADQKLDNTSTTKTPTEMISTSGTKKGVNYSNLRYAVEDVQLNFRNEKSAQSKENMKTRLSSTFGTENVGKYDTSRLSSSQFQTNLFGKVLSNLQNSRIEVSLN